ncbi:MAG: hypothetical protein ACO1QR_01320 [Chthoniobacteraceae bacterium]
MTTSRPRCISAALLLAIATTLSLPVQAQDAPAVDMAQILQALKALKTQQVQQTKSQKMRALQDVSAGASNPSKAADMWEEAVRATQFAGSSKEGEQYREWKDNEGSALRTKEVASALRLHFNWLAITLQRSAGAEIKELLPAIIQHTKEATASKAAMEHFDENMKREREQANARPGRAERKNNDGAVKKMYDQVISKSVANGVVAKWLQIEPLVNDVSKDKQKGGWEMSPANVDGIFGTIVLPELRAQKDPRVLEYWDMRLRTEAEEAAKNKLDFEAGKFNTVTRPQLLWERAQDMAAIGQRNRAISEMFNLVKTHPSHPNASAWVSSLEQQLSEALTPAPAPATAAPAAPAPAAAPKAR